MYFMTKSGSTYYFDPTRKLVWGGVLKNTKTPYQGTPSVIVGERAQFNLGNKIMTTSTVAKVG